MSHKIKIGARNQFRGKICQLNEYHKDLGNYSTTHSYGLKQTHSLHCLGVYGKFSGLGGTVKLKGQARALSKGCP